MAWLRRVKTACPSGFGAAMIGGPLYPSLCIRLRPPLRLPIFEHKELCASYLVGEQL
jgi:hypothetical protein